VPIPGFLFDDPVVRKDWAGYLDAEGSFITSGKRVYFKVDSCDKGILHQAWEKLRTIGIQFPSPRLVRPKNSQVGHLVSQCDLWRLASENKAVLLQLCELVTPYLKHEKRYADTVRVKTNIIARLNH
jgi:hypothetical protein